MSKTLPMLAPALLLLAACAPTATESASVPATTQAPTTTSPAAPSPSSLPAAGHVGPASAQADSGSVAESTGASISGAIREGNRAPPALRVCATPVDGGTPTCIDTRQGANRYRVELAPGRYYLLGWVRSGELKLIAHASQIRCIRAPCPPDELIAVTVAAGEQRDGIDLDAGYVELPAGWPQAPS